jgi:hypothetical protein
VTIDLMPRQDTPLVVELPAPGADRPAWTKVGIVALVGFAIGILWPRFTGTRIAPSPPGEGSGPATEATAAASASTRPLASGAPPAAAQTEPAINVGPGAILRCRDNEDEAVKECGSLQFDPVAIPVIKGLTHCRTAKEMAGQLSLGFEVDFRKRKVRPVLGKATTLPTETAQALLKCTEVGLENAMLGDMKHKHRRYTIFYTASLAAPGAAAEGATPAPSEGPAAGTTTSETPLSGSATVAWDVAVVRDTPKAGAIVGRILRGTKVKLVARQGEWLRIQAGSIEGWAYRGALGM